MVAHPISRHLEHVGILTTFSANCAKEKLFLPFHVPTFGSYTLGERRQRHLHRGQNRCGNNGKRSVVDSVRHSMRRRSRGGGGFQDGVQAESRKIRQTKAA